MSATTPAMVSHRSPGVTRNRRPMTGSPGKNRREALADDDGVTVEERVGQGWQAGRSGRARHVEVSRSDVDERDAWERVGGRAGVRVETYPPDEGALKRRMAGQRGGDLRHRRQAFVQLIQEQEPPVGRPGRRLEVDPRGHQPARVDADVVAHHAHHALDHDCRSGQQHERERHLLFWTAMRPVA